MACIEAWNNWLFQEWHQAYPERIVPMGITYLADTEWAVREIRRMADLGFTSVTFPEKPHAIGLPPLFDRDHWDPIIQACVDTDMVISLHVASSGGYPSPPGAPSLQLGATMFGQLSLAACAEWLWSGYPKDFPTLKIAMSEGGIGWVPMLLDRLDNIIDRSGYGLRLGGAPGRHPPAQLLVLHDRRSVDDRLRHRIGVENIWSRSTTRTATARGPTADATSSRSLGPHPRRRVAHDVLRERRQALPASVAGWSCCREHDDVASLLRDRADDDHTGLFFEDATWTWARGRSRRARCGRPRCSQSLRRPGPFHVGVLLENVPEYLFLLGGAALAGAAVVGINPTRRGAELARDIRHTDCQLIVTDAAHAHAARRPRPRRARPHPRRRRSPTTPTLLAAVAGAPLPEPSTRRPTRSCSCCSRRARPAHPRRVRMTQGRRRPAARPELRVHARRRPLLRDAAVPRQRAQWPAGLPALAPGATVVLRRKFSASGFLPDVRRYGCTFFTHVGRAIAHILATAADATTTATTRSSRLGTEASDAGPAARSRALRRARCSRATARARTRSSCAPPDTPAGRARRRRRGGADVAVVDPRDAARSARRPSSTSTARLLNADEAIGEIVSRNGGGASRATTTTPKPTPSDAQRLVLVGRPRLRRRRGRLLLRRPQHATGSASTARTSPPRRSSASCTASTGAVMSPCTPCPTSRTGDQVMAAIEMRAGDGFDPDAFAAFLAEQRDLGTKWAPRYVRIVDDMPLTATNKVNKQPLRAAGWSTDDPVWWRPDRSASPTAGSPPTTPPRSQPSSPSTAAPTSCPASPPARTTRTRGPCRTDTTIGSMVVPVPA